MFFRPIIINILLLLSLTLHGEVIVYESRQLHYDRDDGLSSALVGGGVQDSNGLLWFATWNGLNCYDGYEFHRVAIAPGDKASIGTNHIRDILMAGDGNIICHTDYGIYMFDLRTYSFRDVTPHEADSLGKLVGKRWYGLTDSQGNRWTADRHGLYKDYNLSFPATVLEGTADGNPRAFMMDREGNLWVGLRTDPSLRVYDPNGNVVKTIPLEGAPYCLHSTADGEIWIGCKPGGLFRVDGSRITSDVVYDIKEDSRGRLWIATFGDGVKCCVRQTDGSVAVSASFGGGKVRQLYITPDDMLVAATDDGLFVGMINDTDLRKIQLRRLARDGNRSESLCSNALLSVGGDGSGHIFICSESSGIDMIAQSQLMAETPEFTHFNMKNSSLTDDIYKGMAVVSDSLLMIVGTDRVMAFDPIADYTVNYGRTFWGDSCDFNETTPLLLPDGKWIFGARQGAYVVRKDVMQTLDCVPPLVFTTLGINGDAPEFCLPPADAVELNPSERNVTINFAALDYVDNRDILYRTRLDDLPWTGASSARSVTLFDLAPGKHTLEVQSTDRYGRWVDNHRLLLITVSPYWYETWWARTLFLLLIIAALAGVIYTYIYIRRVDCQRKELLEKYMALINSSTPENAEENESVEEKAGENLAPDQKPEDTVFLNRVRRYIEENIANPDANIDDMAATSATSRSTLNRHLRSQLGITAAQLLIEARLQRAVQLLESKSEEECSLTDIAMLCGYSDPYYFQRVFKKKYGHSPADYRTKNFNPNKP